jgi:hypothetical protein
MTQALTERLHVLISPEELRAVDDWGWAQRIRSKGEVVRRLIQRGLKPDARPEPTKATETTPAAPARKAVRPEGGFKWETVAQTETGALNVKIPLRLKLQLDWIVRERRDAREETTQRRVVEDLIQEYVAKELRSRGIEP